jgi:hypothetical protein
VYHNSWERVLAPTSQEARALAWKFLAKGFSSVLVPTNGISFTFLRFHKYYSQEDLPGAI